MWVEAMIATDVSPLYNLWDVLVDALQVVNHNSLCNRSQPNNFDVDGPLQGLPTRLRGLSFNCQGALYLCLIQRTSFRRGPINKHFDLHAQPRASPLSQMTVSESGMPCRLAIPSELMSNVESEEFV